MEFNSQNLEANFATLDQALTGEVDATKANFIREFIEFFGEGANYQAHRAAFDDTTIFGKVVEQLNFTKPPIVIDILRLIMVYSRNGSKSFFFFFFFLRKNV